MSFYQGRYAELYDLFYCDKPYADEARFVHDRLCWHAGEPPLRILELACGTGRHAIELAKLGCSITATDCSDSMLKVAAQKGSQARANITFDLCDMSALPTTEQPFDAVICLFDSIGYLGADENIASMLDGVRRNLKRGGLFLFEFWHADTMVKKFEPVRIRRLETDTSSIIRLSETTLDIERRQAHVRYDIYELKQNGTYEFFSETQSNRFFTVDEMEGFANRAGFEPLAAYAGFSESLDITDETWHIVAVWRRSDKPSEVGTNK
ncbi:class I SAM-dependent methyltransferase [Methylocystis sp. 9N]|uniref:Class I SAM-dependent methyltransferase n=1 Tax=Methylocystis borbori TaxID=3118750 RepID=A0ABU7XC57_9HYPH